MDSSSATLSSVLDELDRAININLQGLTAGQEPEPGSDEYRILDLRQQLHEHFRLHGDCDLSTIHLDWTSSPVPLPGWVPKAVTDAMGVTKTLTASEALAKAISKPRAAEITSLTSAVGKALSVR